MSEGEQKENKVVKTANSLVFISHDTRDAKLAEAFSGLLKSVSAGVLKSFRTSDRKGNQGIEYGVEWYPEIIKNIQEASDVVCLLTKKSVDRPWILFEAGMAKGKLETPILGLALGISLNEASTGPFAQFQNCADDEESLTKLVFQLVDRIPNSEPDEDTIRFQVDKFKQTIKEIFESEDSEESKTSTDDENINNSSAKLFEEIKVMFKDLPSRIESSKSRMYGSKKRHFHPMMLEKMFHKSKNIKTSIMVCLGLMREKMPWLYDSGVEVLGVLDGKANVKKKKEAFFEFEEMVKLSIRHPVVEELLGFKDEYMFYEESLYMILREMDRLLHNKTQSNNLESRMGL